MKTNKKAPEVPAVQGPVLLTWRELELDEHDFEYEVFRHRIFQNLLAAVKAQHEMELRLREMGSNYKLWMGVPNEIESKALQAFFALDGDPAVSEPDGAGDLCGVGDGPIP